MAAPAKGTAFACGDVACVESTAPGKSAATTRTAFVPAGSRCYEIRVTAASRKGHPSFGRPEFTRLIESARFAYVRCGDWDSYPPRVLETFTAALRQTPNEVAWVEERCAKQQNDYVPLLVMGELLQGQTNQREKRIEV